MRILVIAIFSLFASVGCAGAKKNADRKTASSGWGVGAHQPNEQVCGQLKRVRYENHEGEHVVKLLIGNINVKFYTKELAPDQALMTRALGSKGISTCYQAADKQTPGFGAYLDFYAK